MLCWQVLPTHLLFFTEKNQSAASGRLIFIITSLTFSLSYIFFATTLRFSMRPARSEYVLMSLRMHVLFFSPFSLVGWQLVKALTCCWQKQFPVMLSLGEARAALCLILAAQRYAHHTGGQKNKPGDTQAPCSDFVLNLQFYKLLLWSHSRQDGWGKESWLLCIQCLCSEPHKTSICTIKIKQSQYAVIFLVLTIICLSVTTLMTLEMIEIPPQIWYKNLYYFYKLI